MNSIPIPSTSESRWGVCTVAIPRESWYWLKDWIDHHLHAGAAHITIYDNTGSTGSIRKSSAFSTGTLQRKATSKRGEPYGRLTAHLSDEQIARELRNLASTCAGRVEIITWTPRHPQLGTVIHGQIEAYCDFIRRYRNVLEWGLFCDLDEYIYCAPGLRVNSVLELIERKLPDVSLIQLLDWQFECRWSPHGPKRIDKLLAHHIGLHGLGKTLARLNQVTHANNHLRWNTKPGGRRIHLHRLDMALSHYNLNPSALQCDGVRLINPRNFLVTPLNPEGGVRILPPLAKCRECEMPLPVETTFAAMTAQPSGKLSV